MRTDSNISERVRHSAPTESVLEFGAHETIAFTGVTEDEEVDAEHGHIEHHGNDDETERAGGEVSDEKPRWDTEVT